MAGLRQVDTAARQATVLFAASGLLGLLSDVLPGAGPGRALQVVYAIALVFGLVVMRLPWERWDPRATLALVPPAIALIVAGRWYDQADIDTLYGLWFVVLFGWVGSWHPARTAVLLAPIAAAAYTIPFLPGAPGASAESLGTVVIAIPIGVVLAGVLAAKTAGMRRAHCALEASAELLERANLTDDLTGVGNRRQANALLDGMAPGDGLVLLDLDHFKVVNDTYGHAEGDRVLMRLGSFLQEAVRDADCVARFGGEEFIILVRGGGRELTGVVERLLDGWRSAGVGVTLSAGAAIHLDGVGPMATLKRADTLLYQAKAGGRDRVVAEPRRGVASGSEG